MIMINGRLEDIPSIETTVYSSENKLKLVPGHSMRDRRTRWIRSIVLHNTKNIPTVVLPGTGPSTDLGTRIAKFWSTNSDPAGAHLSVDWDGKVFCHADLVKDAAYHASAMNEVSIGIEIYQDSKGQVYEQQLWYVYTLVDWLCCRFGIQRQIPLDTGKLNRLSKGGQNAVGVFGHCHNNAAKSNDPGTDIFALLAVNGYHKYTFSSERDLMQWRAMQSKLNVQCDGIPGPATVDALRDRGFAHGLYDWKTEL